VPRCYLRTERGPPAVLEPVQTATTFEETVERLGTSRDSRDHVETMPEVGAFPVYRPADEHLEGTERVLAGLLR
jgi:hypothetical protein